MKLVKDDDEDSRFGQAVHDFMKRLVAGEYADIDQLSVEYRVDEEEFGRICRLGKLCWNGVAEHFPEPTVEEQIEAEWVGSILLHGRPDLFSLLREDREIRLGDWKSGFRMDVDHTDQVKGYAAILLELNPWAERVRVCVIRIREGVAHWVTYERAEIETWLAQAARRLARSNEYATGRHCGYCPRGHECEAKTTRMAQSMRVLLGEALTNLPADPTERADYLGRLKDAKALAQEVLDDLGPLLKAEVEAAGGSMTMTDGRELYIHRIEKKEILAGPAEPILREALGGRFADCLKVSKTKVESVVKTTAPPRGKGAAVHSLMKRLDDAGALVVRTEERLETRRTPLRMAQTA